MRILDIYIARKFLEVLFFALIAFISIFIIIDLIENLDNFMGEDIPKIIILKYQQLYAIQLKFCDSL